MIDHEIDAPGGNALAARTASADAPALSTTIGSSTPAPSRARSAGAWPHGTGEITCSVDSGVNASPARNRRTGSGGPADGHNTSGATPVSATSVSGREKFRLAVTHAPSSGPRSSPEPEKTRPPDDPCTENVLLPLSSSVPA